MKLGAGESLGRVLALGLALALSVPGAMAAPRTACHIHPPQAAPGDEAPVSTIGPLSVPADCEVARARLFGDLGRCHCTTGFASVLAPGGSGEAAGRPAPRPGPGLP